MDIQTDQTRGGVMVYDLIMNFGSQREYEFKLQDSDLAATSADDARRWFDRQFDELGCEPINPMGKVLIADKILGVARALGHRPFAGNDETARRFVRFAALALNRHTIRVDVPGSSIGY